MNNAISMGMKFYATGKAKPTPVGSAGDTGVGSDAGPRGVATNIGGGASSSAMRGGIGQDEAYFMVKRARSAAGKPLVAKSPAYKSLGGLAEQRIPDGNVLDTTYGVRVGGVFSSMEFDNPETHINSDAIKVWDKQVEVTDTFAIERMGEWTGRPPIVTPQY